MKYSINLRSDSHLPLIQPLPVTDVLLQTKKLCRSGGIDSQRLLSVLHSLKCSGKKPVLAWDCLVKDNEIEDLAKTLRPLIPYIHAIRFVDPGIGLFLMSEFPEINLELSLEHGSLNGHAIQHWATAFLPQLSKIILSPQLPLPALKQVRSLIPVATEILATGPIAIFYSRRCLLPKKPLSKNGVRTDLTIASDDRPDQKNPILESTKGTLAYLDRLLNIFHRHEEAAKAGIDFFRVEYLSENDLKEIVDGVSRWGWLQGMQRYQSSRSSRGFLDDNPTDKLFSVLKNRYLSQSSEQTAGSVIEAVKPRYSLIKLETPLTLPRLVKFTSPEGKYVTVNLIALRDLKGTTYTDLAEPGIYLTDWFKYVVTGSVIEYLGEQC